MQVVLLRCAQEALANVRKHARADRVRDCKKNGVTPIMEVCTCDQRENIAVASEAGVSPTAVDDRFPNGLVARAEGLQLTGEGGLLQQLTKRLLERAMLSTCGSTSEGMRRAYLPD